MTPKIQSIRRKIDKLDFIRLKTFALQKAIKRIKRQATYWKKIFANYIFDKELVTRVY